MNANWKGTVSVRKRFEGDHGEVEITNFIKSLRKIINDRSITHRKEKQTQRLNDEITAKEVRLISVDGEQLGVVSIDVALERASEIGLDLIEVGPNSKPPVCRILDYGKLKYEEKKKRQLSKKKQHVIKVKEIRLRPRIDEHDLMTKLNQGKKFLSEGAKLKGHFNV